MIITKTPFRMSFFGGGTDIPEFFNEHGGAVISTTFDKYCYVTVRHLPRFFEWKTHLTYSKMEYVDSYEQIQHPLIRNTMEMLDMHELRLTYDADLPARSGLGTSSSFAVGMLNAFYSLKGKYVDRQRLASDAIHVERELCMENGGWQDQIAASFGGLNRIDFHDNTFDVRPIIISRERKQSLNDNLMLFFTGFTRLSSEVQKNNLDNSNRITREESLLEMLEIVDDAEAILTDESANLDEFGRLLDVSWKLKKKTGDGISNSGIDDMYFRGIQSGALGGKLLGAGGGGFLLFYIKPENREALMKAMNGLLHIPFEFEDSGTQVIYYESENYSK